MAKKLRSSSCCGRGARIGKSIVRNASKSMEKTMVRQAKSLFKNPFEVLPDYDDAESKKRFRKIYKQLEKVNKIKDDLKKLEKRAKKKNLAGAVAGTLLIAHAEKAPFLAAAKLPSGTVYYAQRGKAPKEYLIASQHTKDPFYRLLGIRDIALKYQLHVYSWNTGFVSTGLKPNPPKEFVDFIINTLDYNKTDNYVYCTHLSTEQVVNKKITDTPYIYIHWRSAQIKIGICQQCASKKENTLFSLTKYVLADDINDDFSISVIGSILKNDSLENNVETEFIDDYLAGKLSDHQFIEKNMNKRHEQLATKDQQVYVLNGTKFDSAKEFIQALDPNKYEKQALNKLVTLHQKPIIVSDATPNDVLAKYWDDYGEDIIYDITNDKDLTKQIMSLSESEGTKIKTAFEIKTKKEVLKHLPRYKSLPNPAEYADELARIYRVQGKEKLFSALRSPPKHPKKRAIAYGMLLVINKYADMKWKFSKIDIESGEFIKPYLDVLLNGNPKKYHESLQQVVTSCGFPESLDKYKIS